MITVLTNRKVKTTKDHRCWGCARIIPKGTTMNLIESVDNGEFSHSYWCKVCEQVWNDGTYRDEDIQCGDLKDDEFWEETRKEVEGI